MNSFMINMDSTKVLLIFGKASLKMHSLDGGVHCDGQNQDFPFPGSANPYCALAVWRESQKLPNRTFRTLGMRKEGEGLKKKPFFGYLGPKV